MAKKISCSTLSKRKHIKRDACSGFSIIELMTVLAIIGVLGLMSYPSYHRYILRSHRVDAEIALLQHQDCLENCFGFLHDYQRCSSTRCRQGVSPQGFYRINLEEVTDTRYKLTATARNDQRADVECRTLSIDQHNIRTATGTHALQCWRSG